MKKNPPIVVWYIGSLIIMGALIALTFLRLPPQIPLLYSIGNEEGQIVDLWIIATIPILSLFFVTVNYTLNRKWFADDELVRSTVRIANFIIVILFTIIFAKIILLVT